MMVAGMSGVNARICQLNSDGIRKARWNSQMQDELKDLLDLNEVMRAFGVNEWHNLGPVEPAHGGLPSILVEIQGQRYILKERPERPSRESASNTNHRYAFQRYLREAGIPIPPLWLTPQGESLVTLDEDAFELQQWVDDAIYNSADPRNLKWVSSAGAMLALFHTSSRGTARPVYHV